jgi:hypothetical protein
MAGLIGSISMPISLKWIPKPKVLTSQEQMLLEFRLDLDRAMLFGKH